MPRRKTRRGRNNIRKSASTGNKRKNDEHRREKSGYPEFDENNSDVEISVVRDENGTSSPIEKRSDALDEIYGNEHRRNNEESHDETVSSISGDETARKRETRVNNGHLVKISTEISEAAASELMLGRKGGCKSEKQHEESRDVIGNKSRRRLLMRVEMRGGGPTKPRIVEIASLRAGYSASIGHVAGVGILETGKDEERGGGGDGTIVTISEPLEPLEPLPSSLASKLENLTLASSGDKHLTRLASLDSSLNSTTVQEDESSNEGPEIREVSDSDAETDSGARPTQHPIVLEVESDLERDLHQVIPIPEETDDDDSELISYENNIDLEQIQISPDEAVFQPHENTSAAPSLIFAKNSTISMEDRCSDGDDIGMRDFEEKSETGQQENLSRDTEMIPRKISNQESEGSKIEKLEKKINGDQADLTGDPSEIIAQKVPSPSNDETISSETLKNENQQEINDLITRDPEIVAEKMVSSKNVEYIEDEKLKSEVEEKIIGRLSDKNITAEEIIVRPDNDEEINEISEVPIKNEDRVKICEFSETGKRSVKMIIHEEICSSSDDDGKCNEGERSKNENDGNKFGELSEKGLSRDTRMIAREICILDVEKHNGDEGAKNEIEEKRMDNGIEENYVDQEKTRANKRETCEKRVKFDESADEGLERDHEMTKIIVNQSSRISKESIVREIPMEITQVSRVPENSSMTRQVENKLKLFIESLELATPFESINPDRSSLDDFANRGRAKKREILDSYWSEAKNAERFLDIIQEEQGERLISENDQRHIRDFINEEISKFRRKNDKNKSSVEIRGRREAPPEPPKRSSSSSFVPADEAPPLVPELPDELLRREVPRPPPVPPRRRRQNKPKRPPLPSEPRAVYENVKFDETAPPAPPPLPRTFNNNNNNVPECGTRSEVFRENARGGAFVRRASSGLADEDDDELRSCENAEFRNVRAAIEATSVVVPGDDARVEIARSNNRRGCDASRLGPTLLSSEKMNKASLGLQRPENKEFLRVRAPCNDDSKSSSSSSSIITYSNGLTPTAEENKAWRGSSIESLSNSVTDRSRITEAVTSFFEAADRSGSEPSFSNNLVDEETEESRSGVGENNQRRSDILGRAAPSFRLFGSRSDEASQGQAANSVTSPENKNCTGAECGPIVDESPERKTILRAATSPDREDPESSSSGAATPNTVRLNPATSLANLASLEFSDVPARSPIECASLKLPQDENNKEKKYQQQPELLKDLCVRKILSLPYGLEIINEITIQKFSIFKNIETIDQWKSHHLDKNNKMKIPRPKTWMGVPTTNDPKLLVCLSPSQQESQLRASADNLLDLHKKYLNRRSYHDDEEKRAELVDVPKYRIDLGARIERPIDGGGRAASGNRLLEIIKENPIERTTPEVAESNNSADESGRDSRTSHCCSNNEDRLRATRLSDWMNLARKNHSRDCFESEKITRCELEKKETDDEFYTSKKMYERVISEMESFKKMGPGEQTSPRTIPGYERSPTSIISAKSAIIDRSRQQDEPRKQNKTPASSWIRGSIEQTRQHVINPALIETKTGGDEAEINSKSSSRPIVVDRSCIDTTSIFDQTPPRCRLAPRKYHESLKQSTAMDIVKNLKSLEEGIPLPRSCLDQQFKYIEQLENQLREVILAEEDERRAYEEFQGQLERESSCGFDPPSTENPGKQENEDINPGDRMESWCEESRTTDGDRSEFSKREGKRETSKSVTSDGEVRVETRYENIQENKQRSSTSIGGKTNGISSENFSTAKSKNDKAQDCKSNGNARDTQFVSPPNGEVFRQRMFDEYVHKVHERQERKQHKLVKISSHVDNSASFAKSPTGETSMSSVEREFIERARNRLSRFGINLDESESELRPVNDRESDAEPPSRETDAYSSVITEKKSERESAKCLIDGREITDAKTLPKHLQEFFELATSNPDDGVDSDTRAKTNATDLLHEIDTALKIGKGFLLAEETVMFAPTFKASSAKPGVWSPGSEPPPPPKLPSPDREKKSEKDAGIPPVWTPSSAGPSPVAERKEFRPVSFESPVLTRKQYTPQHKTEASPPWKAEEGETKREATESVTHNITTRIVNSHSAPSQGLNTLAGTPRLPRAQNPTITLLQKAREGQIPKGAAYLDESESRTSNFKTESSSRIEPAEIIYTVKREYESEPESTLDRPKKMADLGPRKIEGIGPTTKDGIPVALRSEVKNNNQARWYKKMYDSLHRADKDDDYITVRYKPRRGARYGYGSSSGYLSEPEPRGTSDRSATLDTRRRQRNKENDFSTSTMPRKVTPLNQPEVYRSQPGRIENYEPGRSSIAERETKEWWDEVMDIFDGWLEDNEEITVGNKSKKKKKEKNKQEAPSSSLDMRHRASRLLSLSYRPEGASVSLMLSAKSSKTRTISGDRSNGDEKGSPGDRSSAGRGLANVAKISGKSPPGSLAIDRPREIAMLIEKSRRSIASLADRRVRESLSRDNRKFAREGGARLEKDRIIRPLEDRGSSILDGKSKSFSLPDRDNVLFQRLNILAPSASQTNVASLLAKREKTSSLLARNDESLGHHHHHHAHHNRHPNRHQRLTNSTCTSSSSSSSCTTSSTNHNVAPQTTPAIVAVSRPFDQRSSQTTKPYMSHALKESGYESDSTLIFRRRDEASPLSPVEQRIAYRTIQKGGDVPLHGLRKPAPERPKDDTEIEYFPISPTLTRIRVRRRNAVTARATSSMSSSSSMTFARYKRTAPSATSSAVLPIGRSGISGQRSVVARAVTGRTTTRTTTTTSTTTRTITKKNSPPAGISRPSTRVVSPPRPPSPPRRGASRHSVTLRSLFVESRNRTLSRSSSCPDHRNARLASSNRHEQCFAAESIASSNIRFLRERLSNKLSEQIRQRETSRKQLSVLRTLSVSPSRRTRPCELRSRTGLLLESSKRSSEPCLTNKQEVSSLPRKQSLASSASELRRAVSGKEKAPLLPARSSGPSSTEKNGRSRRLLSAPKNDHQARVPRRNKEPSDGGTKRIVVATETGARPREEASRLVRSTTTSSKNVSRSHLITSPQRASREKKSSAIGTCDGRKRPREKPLTIVKQPAKNHSEPVSTGIAPRTKQKPERTRLTSGVIRAETRRSIVKEEKEEIEETNKRMKKSRESGKRVTRSKTENDRGSSPRMKGIIEEHQRATRTDTFFQNLFLGRLETAIPSTPRTIRRSSVMDRARMFQEWPSDRFKSEPSLRSLGVYLAHKRPVSNSRFKNWDRESVSSRSSSPCGPSTPGKSIYRQSGKLDGYLVGGTSSEFGSSSSSSLLLLRAGRSPSSTTDCANKERSQSEPPLKVSCPAEEEEKKNKQIRESSPSPTRSAACRRIKSLRERPERARSASESEDRARSMNFGSVSLMTRSTGSLEEGVSTPSNRDEYQRYVLESRLRHGRRKSERYRELHDFYASLERMGQLERSTSTSELRPRSRDEEIIDYERWKDMRSKERAEQELREIYGKLKIAQREKDFLFTTRDPEKIKWRGDCGLRSKERSVENIRESFRRLEQEESESEASRRREIASRRDVYKPLWRGNSVARLASNMTIKNNKLDDPQSREQDDERSRVQPTLEKHLGGSKKFWSSLSIEQVTTLKNQLNEIYGTDVNGKPKPSKPEPPTTTRSDSYAEYEIVVPSETAGTNEFGDDSEESTRLHVRCHSMLASGNSGDNKQQETQSEKQSANKQRRGSSIGNGSRIRNKSVARSSDERRETGAGALSETEKKRLSLSLSKEILDKVTRKTGSSSSSPSSNTSPRTCYSLERCLVGNDERTRESRSDFLLVLTPNADEYSTRSKNRVLENTVEEWSRKPPLVAVALPPEASLSELDSATESSETSVRTVVRRGSGAEIVPRKVEFFEKFERNVEKGERPGEINENKQRTTTRLSSAQSFADLKELFGEIESARVPFRRSPPGPAGRGSSTVPRGRSVSVSPDVTEERIYRESSLIERARSVSPRPISESTWSLESSARASPDPERYWRAYQNLIRRNNSVRRLRAKFESLEELSSSERGAATSFSRPKRFQSDPELTRNLLKRATEQQRDKRKNKQEKTEHLASIKYTENNCYSRGRARSRRTARSPPIPRIPLRVEDLSMPRINVISKTAELKEHKTRSGSTDSLARKAETEELQAKKPVARLRDKFESRFDGRTSILGEMFTSAPNVNELRDIAPYLAGRWVAHKFPSRRDNARSLSLPPDLETSGAADTADVAPAKSRVTDRTTRLVKSAERESSSKQEESPKTPSSILKQTQSDPFANQTFDPSKHRPRSRYQPPPPPPPPPPLPAVDSLSRRTESTSWWPALPTYTAKPSVTFEEYANAPPPPPKAQHNRSERPESPRRYVESEVTIHYRSPVRHEAKEILSEEELARRSAENMRRVYQEERRRKYLQELHDIDSRRHTDNFVPSQKSPIPLNRYDDFVDDLSYRSRSQEQTPEPRLVARALYNFVGQSSRELTFRRGDLIFVRRQVDKNWYEGEHNAMIGLFPFNYVEILPYDGTRTTPKKPYEGQARAKFNFVAQTNLELSLAKGELVVITRRVDENWYEGRIGNRRGIFPVSYVEVITEPGHRPETPVQSSKPVASPAAHSLLSNGTAGGKLSMGAHHYTPSMPLNMSTTQPHYNSLPRMGGNKLRVAPVNETLHIDTHSETIPYRALYNYRPQNEDELELREGDTVYVMEKCDDGWYVGSSQRTGYFGTFPGNYVEPL